MLPGPEISLNFNPHHPRGWRLSAWFSNFDAASEISIHTTLAGGDKSMGLKRLRRIISIHTTLAGGDGSVSGYRERVRHFNPHHPRGWRPPHRRYRKGPPQFQSTPPSRVATYRKRGRQDPARVISIHTTLAGGDCIFFFITCNTEQISIHTTLAGGDL